MGHGPNGLPARPAGEWQNERRVDADQNRVLGSPFVVRVARWGVVAWAIIGVAAIVGSFFWFVVRPVRVVFPPLVVALIVVFLLNPIVSRLERRGLGRLWGSLLTYLVFVGLVGVGLRYLIPVIVEQVQEFDLSAVVVRLQHWIRDLARGFGFDIGPVATGGQRVVADFVTGLVSFTRGVFNVVLIFVLGPILAFYLLVDLPKIRRAIRALVPERRKEEVSSVARDLSRALGGFFRGQLLVSLFVGLASSLGLFIVGLPYWAVVGMISGLFNLIPLIGPFIGAFVAIIVAFTVPSSAAGLIELAPGLPLAVGAGIALTIVQQIDNHILSPNIVARTVKLHPVTVMLALLAGGTLLGLWGMLLAVPTMASVKVLALHAWDTRMTWPPPTDETDSPDDRGSLGRWWRRHPHEEPAEPEAGEEVSEAGR